MAYPFEALMAELAERVEPLPGSDLAQGGGFKVDGVEFAIARACSPVELLSVFCTFGRLPPYVPEKEFLRLLETNLILAGSCSGSFGAIGDTREVVYAHHLPMRDLSAALLMESLRHTAEQARAWQQAHLEASEADGVLP